MATPDEGRKRTWRFRLNDATTLEVSTPPRTTEKQVRRRGRFSLVLGTLVAAVMFIAAASADNLNDTLAAGSVTNPTINVGGSFSTTINYQVEKTGANNTSFPATVNFALSGAPAWVSLNATSRTFTGYSDVQSITVSGTAPNGSGGATYNFSVEPSTSAANLNPTPAKVNMSVTVNAPSDTDAPAVTHTIGTPNHVSGSDTYVTSATTLMFNMNEVDHGDSGLSACTVDVDGPFTNDGSFTCVEGDNDYTLSTSAPLSLPAAPDGSYDNSASATDNNSNTGNDSFTVILDNTAPTFGACIGGPFLLNSGGGSQAVGITASDGGSGLDAASSSLSGTVDTTSVGPKTVNYAAKDNLGNTAMTSCNYSVIFDFTGFFTPIDNLPALNVVKAGQAVPVKFSLNGDQGLGILAAGYPKWKFIYCDPTVPQDGVEETMTAGHSSLSYDAVADQYVYVWKTDKAWATKCMSLEVKLIDGTSHYANFKFTK